MQALAKRDFVETKMETSKSKLKNEINAIHRLEKIFFSFPLMNVKIIMLKYFCKKTTKKLLL